MIIKKFEKFILEDVYYEKEPKEILTKENVEKLVKTIIDEESEWVYVRANGKDIEVGTMPYTNKDGKKITPKFDGDECNELAQSIINKLSQEGYGDYEILYIGSSSFRLEKIN